MTTWKKRDAGASNKRDNFVYVWEWIKDKLKTKIILHENQNRRKEKMFESEEKRENFMFEGELRIN